MNLTCTVIRRSKRCGEKVSTYFNTSLSFHHFTVVVKLTDSIVLFCFSVENAVTDSDAMMSQALTKALMDDEEYREKIDHMWGGSGSSIEIEASVLCDTHEFLKRKDDAGLDEK